MLVPFSKAPGGNPVRQRLERQDGRVARLLWGANATSEVIVYRDSTRGHLAGGLPGLFRIKLEGNPTERVYIAHVGLNDDERDGRVGPHGTWLFARDVVVAIRVPAGTPTPQYRPGRSTSSDDLQGLDPSHGEVSMASTSRVPAHQSDAGDAGRIEDVSNFEDMQSLKQWIKGIEPWMGLIVIRRQRSVVENQLPTLQPWRDLDRELWYARASSRAACHEFFGILVASVEEGRLHSIEAYGLLVGFFKHLAVASDTRAIAPPLPRKWYDTLELDVVGVARSDSRTTLSRQVSLEQSAPPGRSVLGGLVTPLVTPQSSLAVGAQLATHLPARRPQASVIRRMGQEHQTSGASEGALFESYWLRLVVQRTGATGVFAAQHHLSASGAFGDSSERSLLRFAPAADGGPLRLKVHPLGDDVTVELMRTMSAPGAHDACGRGDHELVASGVHRFDPRAIGEKRRGKPLSFALAAAPGLKDDATVHIRTFYSTTSELGRRLAGVRVLRFLQRALHIARRKRRRDKAVRVIQGYFHRKVQQQRSATAVRTAREVMAVQVLQAHWRRHRAWERALRRLVASLDAHERDLLSRPLKLHQAGLHITRRERCLFFFLPGDQDLNAAYSPLVLTWIDPALTTFEQWSNDVAELRHAAERRGGLLTRSAVDRAASLGHAARDGAASLGHAARDGAASLGHAARDGAASLTHAVRDGAASSDNAARGGAASFDSAARARTLTSLGGASADYPSDAAVMEDRGDTPAAAGYENDDDRKARLQRALQRSEWSVRPAGGRAPTAKVLQSLQQYIRTLRLGKPQRRKHMRATQAAPIEEDFSLSGLSALTDRRASAASACGTSEERLSIVSTRTTKPGVCMDRFLRFEQIEAVGVVSFDSNLIELTVSARSRSNRSQSEVLTSLRLRAHSTATLMLWKKLIKTVLAERWLAEERIERLRTIRGVVEQWQVAGERARVSRARAASREHDAPAPTKNAAVHGACSDSPLAKFASQAQAFVPWMPLVGNAQDQRKRAAEAATTGQGASKRSRPKMPFVVRRQSSPRGNPSTAGPKMPSGHSPRFRGQAAATQGGATQLSPGVSSSSIGRRFRRGRIETRRRQ